MSLPSKKVLSQLKKHWVVGWKNIEKEKYVGRSHGYTKKQTSVGTTNGAGPTNMQLFMLSPDLVVLHALPGFWHSDDLNRELKLGRKMLKLWQNKELSRAEKDRQFCSLQMEELKNQPLVTTERSGWQDFDMRAEQARYKAGQKRDTFLCDRDGYVQTNGMGQPKMKPTNRLVHERMSKRPFVPYAKFDVRGLADYGTSFYDNNLRVDGKGKNFAPKHGMRNPRQVRKVKQGSVRGGPVQIPGLKKLLRLN